MNREYTAAEFKRVVDYLLEHVPGVTIATVRSSLSSSVVQFAVEQLFLKRGPVRPSINQSIPSSIHTTGNHHPPKNQFPQDVICGFPGETEEDFDETVALVAQYKFPVVNISQVQREAWVGEGSIDSPSTAGLVPS